MGPALHLNQSEKAGAANLRRGAMMHRLRTKSYLAIWLISVGSLLGFWFIGQSSAAPAASSAGLSVTPAYTQIILKPDQKTQDYTVSVANHYDKAITLSVSFNDLTQTGENGGLILINPRIDTVSVFSSIATTSEILVVIQIGRAHV